MKIISVILAAMVISTISYAQRTSDVENSKDHPLISRFDGAIIEFYKETKFGTYKIPLDENGKLNYNKPMILKGKVTRIQYSIPIDNNPEYVLHNYSEACNGASFTILTALTNEQLGVGERSQDWNSRYYGSGDAYFYNALNNEKYGMHHDIPNWKANQAYIVAKAEKGDKHIYFAIYVVDHDNFTLIIQDVIEVSAPKTGMVTAEKLSKGIAANGHIAVYGIHFEIGNSNIKAESGNSLTLIADYLKSVEGKKFFIVGHTDNTGLLAENMKLSESRAKSVMDKLVNDYSINPSQLVSYGVSSLAPIASNQTDEGKAKNRRVEIVEQ